MPSKNPPPLVISAPQPVPPSNAAATAKRIVNKPQISINIPAAHLHHQLHSPPSSTIGGGGLPSYLKRGFGGAPTTAGSGTPNHHHGWSGSPYANPFSMLYPTAAGKSDLNGESAGQFMFKHLEGFKDFTFASAKSGLNIGEKSAFYIYEKFSKWSRQWFTHCFLFLVILLYSIAGAYIFMAIEGPALKSAVDDIRSLKYNFSEKLHRLAQDKHLQRDLVEWQGAVDRELQPFIVEMTSMFKSGYFDEDQKSKPTTWSFWNAMFYCGTIYTTIGYGHMYAVTKTGQAVTMAYAIIGIPMFLILLADFGKLFTRGMKFLWAYVRRLYYTGSLRQVRKQAQVQEVLRGMNIAYEIATFRRPSMMMNKEEAPAGISEDGHLSPSSAAGRAEGDETPVTPVPTEIEIDDEFNLPISVAIILLITYILFGAAVYSIWEDWTFFEACYFVFISMSTIGFGDFVPKHPIFMMASILYLIFGLALTSMCINVVQVKLSDSFRQASAKISATIGLSLAEAEAEEEAQRQSLSSGQTPGGGAVDNHQQCTDEPVLVHRKLASKENRIDVPPGDYPQIVISNNNESNGRSDEDSRRRSSAAEMPPLLPPKKVQLNETVHSTETKPKRKGFFRKK